MAKMFTLGIKWDYYRSVTRSLRNRNIKRENVRAWSLSNIINTREI